MIKQRQSNFELLRIVAMLMIISTHCIASTKAFIAISSQEEQYLLNALQTLSLYGVNLFVLITGYFMVGRTKVSVRKVVVLLLDVAVYGLVMYGISIAIGVNTFSLSDTLKAALPILAGYRWFILAYIVLYLLSPLINSALLHISKKSFMVFLAIYFVLFSVWPTFLPNPPLDDYGYSFHHLIFIYLIGGYIKLYVKDVKVTKWTSVFIVSFLCTFILYCIPNITFPIIGNAYATRDSYNSVFVIMATVAIFMLFSKLKFQNKAINIFASSAFAVFLIHGDYNMMDYIFNNIFHIGIFYEYKLWIIPYLLCIIAIYLICAVIDLAKRKILDKPIGFILDKIKFLNYNITTEET